jgi:hypothetical protein
MPKPAIVQLNLLQYRSFIRDLRSALGVGANTSAGPTQAATFDTRATTVTPTNSGGPDVEVHGSYWSFGYRRSDLYLTHAKAATEPVYHRLPDNYHEMNGRPNSVARGSIVNACTVGPSGRGAQALMALITSEAARSQVIYQVVQQSYHSNRDIPYEIIQPLLAVWGEYSVDQSKPVESHRKAERYHHKSRPTAYGPLGVRDYYDDPNARAAMKEIEKAGVQLDP